MTIWTLGYFDFTHINVIWGLAKPGQNEVSVKEE